MYIYTYEVFSNWLYIWFLIHYYGYIDVSPLIFIIIGIIGSIFSYNKFNFRYMMNIIIKTIQIVLIFKLPLFNEGDLLFGIILSYIYIVVLLYNNKNPIDIYLKILRNR
jgi:hypothetical protein